MKTKVRAIFSVLVIPIGLASEVLGQAGVTDPVGFVTQTIKGTGGSETEVENLLTLSFVSESEDAVTVESVDGNVISVAGAGWETDEFVSPVGCHFVEVRSGAGSGLILDIVATGGSSIEIARLPEGVLAAGDSLFIRRNFTIGDVFGAQNAVGYLGGTDPSAVDNVVLLDPETKVQRVFYYHDDGTDAEWRQVGEVGDASSAFLPFPVSVMVLRRGAADLSHVTFGHVPFYTAGGEFVAFLPVWPGQNLISFPFAVSTLDSSSLYNKDSPFAVTAGDSATEADVLVFTDNESAGVDVRFDPVYYRAGEGWRRVGQAGGAGTWQVPFSSSVRYHRFGPPGWVRFETGFDGAAARARAVDFGEVAGTRITPAADGEVTVSWPTTDGAHYQMQRLELGGSGAWADHGGVRAGDGTQGSAEVAAAEGGAYFRVIEIQNP